MKVFILLDLGCLKTYTNNTCMFFITYQNVQDPVCNNV